MPSDYIPADDNGRLQWIIVFNTWLQANGASFGFSPAKLAAMAAETAKFQTAMSAHSSAHAASKAATVGKNRARASALALVREFARQLQAASETTNADRAAAGLTVPDLNPTPAPPDLIQTIPPPLLWLDFSARQQVTIHWGPNPQNGRRNGRPRGVIGCTIEFHRGGLPEPDSDWTFLDEDTESPYVHIVHDTEPTTYAYRVCYVGKKLKRGPYSAPAVCTVSV